MLERKPPFLGSREQMDEPHLAETIAPVAASSGLAGTSARAPAHGGNTSSDRGARRSTSPPRSGSQGRCAFHETTFLSTMTNVPPGRSTRRTSPHTTSSDRGARCSKTSTAMTPSKLARPNGSRRAVARTRVQDPTPRRACPRRGPARPHSPPARPEPCETGPCRSPGRARGGPASGDRFSTSASSRGSSAATSSLNRPRSDVEPGGDDGFMPLRS